jgi:deoxycytidine triphosphate deaminase
MQPSKPIKMGILTDSDIREILCTTPPCQDLNKLLIENYFEDSLTAVGYDLRIGNKYASKKQGAFIINEGGAVEIYPNDTVLIITRESISMPKDKSISGIIQSKVSIVAKGLSHVATTIDADWSGKLLIVITNNSSNKISLLYEQPFCTAVFISNRTPSTKPSGKQDSRPDILMEEWEQERSEKLMKEWEQNNIKIRKKNKLLKILIFSIIPLSLLVGFLLFGNSSGIIATTGAGVGITSLLYQKITKI